MTSSPAKQTHVLADAERERFGRLRALWCAGMLRRRLLALSLLTSTACQDYGLAEDDAIESGGGAGALTTPTILHVVVRGYSSGLWTGGIIDRATPCVVETESGEDYRRCCPAGFMPFGFWNLDVGVGAQPYSVNCIEESPESVPRGVLYVSSGGTYDGAWNDGWTGGGSWSGGVYSPLSCAKDVVVDRLNADDPNPPDDFRACCPEGYDAVGGANRADASDITCLQRR